MPSGSFVFLAGADGRTVILQGRSARTVNGKLLALGAAQASKCVRTNGATHFACDIRGGFPAEPLLDAAQAFVDPEACDNENEQAGSSTQDSHRPGDLIETRDYLLLFGLHVGFGLVEEELIVFPHGQGAAVDQQDDQESSYGTPDDQQHGQRR